VRDALLISVTFPRSAYSGGELGTDEPLPSPARLHAAFVGAAAGGPWAVVEGGVLAALPEHAAAVRWLEENEPLGLIAPAWRSTSYDASRYRLRAAVSHLNQTPFEPFSALKGPVVYAWPAADQQLTSSLAALAAEITHLGRAEGSVIVDVRLGPIERAAGGFLELAPGRGPGWPLRIPLHGRFDALVRAHRDALRAGGHGTGSKGKQATDEQPLGAGEARTSLRRFAASRQLSWPYAEAWRMVPTAGLRRWMLRLDRRVAFAAAVHRAVVAAVDTDVPPFVTGRDGEGPLRGAGHLAIHLTTLGEDRRPTVVLGLPAGTPEADRATLMEKLGRGLRVAFGRDSVRLSPPLLGRAVPFWPSSRRPMATEVPMVLDAPGTPRNAPWSIEDSVVCSVGYAMRGVLEEAGFDWGVGWEFRRALAARLRELGVDARARRVAGSASSYAHRARPGDLLVAVDAIVRFGELADEVGLLALGRSRHLGGGLLRPLIGAV
jgi:CRISPR-associated protein Csb2